MLDIIINEVEEFNQLRKKLRATSPLFPDFIWEKRGAYPARQLILSTLVRLQRNAVWYKVHYMQTYVLNNSTPMPEVEINCLRRFIAEAYKLQLLYMVNTDVVDSLADSPQEIDRQQHSEIERLTKTKIL